MCLGALSVSACATQPIGELAQRELEMVRHLESIGLTPHLLDHGGGDDLVWIRYQRLVPLTQWLVGAEASDRYRWDKNCVPRCRRCTMLVYATATCR